MRLTSALGFELQARFWTVCVSPKRHGRTQGPTLLHQPLLPELNLLIAYGEAGLTEVKLPLDMVRVIIIDAPFIAQPDCDA